MNVNGERLEEFVCQRCNECCRQPGFVYLNSSEAESIAAFLKISAFDFVNQYCDLQDRSRLVLKKNSDESCIFLSAEGCSIHPVKPAQCRGFPVKWRTINSFDYCAGLKALGRVSPDSLGNFSDTIPDSGIK